MSDKTLKSLIRNAQGKRVICVGDVMLDRFVYGDVERVSPEAPVPVLRHTKSVSMAGGAGNVARNLVSLGMSCTLLGIIGNDPEGQELTNSCAGVETKLTLSKTRGTIVKTRFVSNGQQLLRVDAEAQEAYENAALDELTANTVSALETADLFVISDYAKGALTTQLIAKCIEAAKDRNIPIIVDPKSDDFSKYHGADFIKPNAVELKASANTAVSTDDDIEAALRQVLGQGHCENIIVTRAARGMSWIGKDQIVHHKQGVAREVFDVSGAGDTSIAAIALGLVGKGSLEQAVELAILASGIAVGKTGTAVVTTQELEAQISHTTNLWDPANFERKANVAKARSWHDEGYSVGFTNGCFDILHPGHLKVLEEARSLCGKLVVGLNSDASVRRLKGETRPVNDEISRAIVLMGLASVDAVVIFEEDTPLELITALRPDLLVKGGDYTKEEIVGADIVEAKGGRVHIVPIVEGHSTTATIARAER